MIPELGQPVRLNHVIIRTEEFVSGQGVIRNWVEHPYVVDGFVMGWRTLSDGRVERITESNGYGGATYTHSEWRPSRYFRGFIIATDLRFKPVWALAEHLEAR